MRFHGFVALLLLPSLLSAQEHQQAERNRALYELARKDLKAFAREVARGADSELCQARSIVRWLAEHLDWKSTDYRKRTVQEILDRGGGNCNELALVAVAALKELEIPMRRVREINIHTLSSRRGETAHRMVQEKGVQYSVFGRRHNDHVWIEIYDRKTGEWYPADPSIGIVGTEEWLRSRAGFGKRFSLDPTAEDMIVPFAIVASDSAGALAINRTRHYLVDGFNDLYGGRLTELSAWNEWVRLLGVLQEKAEGAFRGRVNLHDYEAEIDTLAVVYERLRKESLAGR